MTRFGRCALVVLACFILAGGSATVRGQERAGPWTIEYRTNALLVGKTVENSAAR